jgi:hypothetical protein
VFYARSLTHLKLLLRLGQFHVAYIIFRLDFVDYRDRKLHRDLFYEYKCMLNGWKEQ